MLQNPIYRGEIRHKEKCYPGEHAAIIDEALWDEVQRKLLENRVEHDTGAGTPQPSLLVGLIYDDAGARMTPSHANKKGTRYRYYVSQGLVRGPKRNAPRGRRVPARDLEALVEDRLRQFLASEGQVFGALEPLVGDVTRYTDLVARAAALNRRWHRLTPREKCVILVALVKRIDLLREMLEIHILPGQLPSILGGGCDQLDGIRPEEKDMPILTFTVQARLKRVGLETRLLIEGADSGARRKPDHSLSRLLAQAYRYNEMVMRSGGKTMAELATEAGVTGSWFTRILRLSFLAPDVVKAILRDHHPIELTAKRLANDVRLPISWEEQRRRH